ncbi:hypothetical protein BGHDH14_bgh03597 [Blumeria hordei DH14]|uniref:RanBD1 domain-containing protein n=1 Tax=Blumeria graminis f. sp. hordei (strain DH14) TaxID=546991 RepID=N1JQV0_BLUG1|nr:hypothetical protein BGHDH14_bgh03597 [Blumeria hordei DH14]
MKIHPPNDDSATTGASEELKHAALSDESSENLQSVKCSEVAEISVVEKNDEKDTIKSIHTKRSSSPLVTDVNPKENLTSNAIPLVKKRSRDQDDEPKDQNISISPEREHINEGAGNGNRTTRLEPEKKRPRDASQDRLSEGSCEIKDPTSVEAPEINRVATKSNIEETSNLTKEPKTTEAPKDSALSFANSTFASLANSTISPFGSLGASKKSIFSSSSNGDESKSVSDVTNNLSSPGKTSFNGTNSFVHDSNDNKSTGLSFSSSTISSFVTHTNGSIFGSSIGSGFASSVGPKLSSFAAPESKSPPIGTKRLKAFGAPESEENGCEGNDVRLSVEDEENATIGAELKSNKTPKVYIDDGEAEEATLLQIRAKLFALESKDAGWKERGVGTLKINAPRTCVSYDEDGSVISGSFRFNGSVDTLKEQGTSFAARLIMRQENTHRVVLNTIILPEMTFDNKNATSSSQLVFTAFEGDKEIKPIMMLLKMSEANAKLFKSEVDSIKTQLP